MVAISDYLPATRLLEVVIERAHVILARAAVDVTVAADAEILAPHNGSTVYTLGDDAAVSGLAEVASGSVALRKVWLSTADGFHNELSVQSLSSHGSTPSDARLVLTVRCVELCVASIDGAVTEARRIMQDR